MQTRIEHPEQGTFWIVSDQQVRIRPLLAADVTLLIDFFHHLSPETRLRRFLEPLPDLPDAQLFTEATKLATIDPCRAAALIATICEAGTDHAIGVVRFACDRDDPHTAEFAIVVRDDYQGRGLGTELLARLIQIAQARGITCLWGLAQAENTAVRHLVAGCGFPVLNETRRGESMMRIDVRPPE